jgi:predicted nucleic acid-binding protein
MDGACFREWARRMPGQSDNLPEDGMIADTAHIHGLTVATRTRDLEGFAVHVVDPFRPPRNNCNNRY